MDNDTRHLGVRIERPAADVYRYAADPANLPLWAAGLASGVRAEDGHWYAESPMGPIEIRMAPENRFGVLDHDVITADGTVMSNPMRVVADGTGCEVVFTVRRRGSTEEEYDRDAAAVLADLHTLKALLETRSRR